MASEKKLSQISDSLSETLKRIDTLQKQSKTSWLIRFRQHLAKNNQHLHSIILAGCVFAVAAGRLQQKSEYEVIQLHPNHTSYDTIYDVTCVKVQSPYRLHRWLSHPALPFMQAEKEKWQKEKGQLLSRIDRYRASNCKAFIKTTLIM